MAKKSNLRLLTIPRGDFTVIRKMGYDKASSPKTDLYEKSGDYVRHRALELVREQIGDLSGNVAEAGVYLGESAITINRLFPDRSLFLYDTFEAFDGGPFLQEVGGGGVSQQRYAEVCEMHGINASFDVVGAIKSKMPYPERCVFRKGYFPETAAPDKEEKFAFVSMDLDSYDSSYAGLTFFYPRLVEGGYIFLAVYNFAREESVDWRCKKAEQDAEKVLGPLKKFPLPDWRGTLVITK
jgi:O-methyltransferase